MNDYEAIGLYAGFALIVFAIGMIWRYQREKIKKRFSSAQLPLKER